MSDKSCIEPNSDSGLSSVSVTGAVTGDGTPGNPLDVSPVSGAAAGTMSAADKTKLDGIAAGATNTSLSGTLPAAVGAAAIGAGTTAARDDHVHAHGNQLGGTLHANAVAAGAAGFMTGADKTKVDLIPTPSAGIQVLGATYTISGDNGAYEDTGLAITLPDAGAYIVWYTARTNISAAITPGAFILVELYNSTDGVALANSEEIGAYASVVSASYYGVPTMITSIVVAASKVIKLYAKTVAPATTIIRTVNSDTNGRTNIGYLKIST